METEDNTPDPQEIAERLDRIITKLNLRRSANGKEELSASFVY